MLEILKITGETVVSLILLVEVRVILGIAVMN